MTESFPMILCSCQLAWASWHGHKICCCCCCFQNAYIPCILWRFGLWKWKKSIWCYAMHNLCSGEQRCFEIAQQQVSNLRWNSVWLDGNKMVWLDINDYNIKFVCITHMEFNSTNLLISLLSKLLKKTLREYIMQPWFKNTLNIIKVKCEVGKLIW